MPDKCNNSDMPPTTEDYLDAISDTVVILTAASAVLFLLTVAMFVDNVNFVLHNYKGNYPKLRTIIIIGLFPSLSLCAMLVLIFPRSHLLLELIASIFLGLSLYNYVTLIPEYFNGFDKMVDALEYASVQFGSVPPCCCLRCFCLPVPVTRKSLALIMALGLQYVVTSPVIGAASMILWLDGKYEKGKFEVDNGYPYIVACTTITTISALYGTHLLAKVTIRNAPHLAALLPKLLSFKTILVLRNAQGAIFTELAKNDTPDCDGILSAKVRAESINQMAFVAEMFLLTIFSRILYRNSQSSLVKPGDIEAVLAGKAASKAQDRQNYGTTGGYR